MEEKSGKFYVSKINIYIKCPVNIFLIQKLRYAYFEINIIDKKSA